MRKLLLAGAALLMLGALAPASAAEPCTGTVGTVTGPAQGQSGPPYCTVLSINSDGSLNVQTEAPSADPVTAVSCSTLCSNLVVDSASGHLVSFQVGADSTLSAAAWWVMVFNATSAPADGAVTPVKCYPVPAGTTLIAATFTPVVFSTGITVVVSTNGCFSKAASAHAFISGDYQ